MLGPSFGIHKKLPIFFIRVKWESDLELLKTPYQNLKYVKKLLLKWSIATPMPDQLNNTYNNFMGKHYDFKFDPLIINTSEIVLKPELKKNRGLNLPKKYDPSDLNKKTKKRKIDGRNDEQGKYTYEEQKITEKDKEAATVDLTDYACQDDA